MSRLKHRARPSEDKAAVLPHRICPMGNGPVKGQKVRLHRKNPMMGYRYCKKARGKWYNIHRVMHGMKKDHDHIYGKRAPRSSGHMTSRMSPFVSGILKDLKSKKESKLLQQELRAQSKATAAKTGHAKLTFTSAQHMHAVPEQKPGAFREPEISLTKTTREEKTTDVMTPVNMAKPQFGRVTEHRPAKIQIKRIVFPEIGPEIKIPALLPQPAPLPKPIVSAKPAVSQNVLVQPAIERTVQKIRPHYFVVNSPERIRTITTAAKVLNALERPAEKSLDRTTDAVPENPKVTKCRVIPFVPGKQRKTEPITSAKPENKATVIPIKTACRKHIGYISSRKRRVFQLKVAQGSEGIPPR